ncbi:MAG TPA: ABC transporter permease [Syntrophorhabdales bacterium]|nr:ABC transporter permease [Syntrophorhabdales bacterium]
MIAYILKRLVFMVPMLLGITIISFVIIHLPPGEPGALGMEMNPKVTKEVRERVRAMYDLDKPIPVQYYLWLKRFARLDFGRSFSSDRRLVIDKITERLPITVSLNLLALMLELGLGIPIGVYCAKYKGSLLDKGLTAFVFAGFAIPTFWLALLCMLLFGVYFDLLPITGLKSFNYSEFSFFGKIADLARHLVLPVLISAFGGLAGMSRFMKSSLLEVLRQDYITTAYAKGLPEGMILRKHAVRNALLSVITLLGMAVPGLIGGSVIFETIFGIPGMGQLFYMSVMSRDFPVIMGILVIGAFLTLVGNLLADIALAVADPRIRIG